MAETLLTPTLIWDGFSVDKNLTTENISESTVDGISVKRFYICGNEKGKSTVKIYAVSASKIVEGKIPALLLLNAPNKEIDEEFSVSLAKEGYFVLSIDLQGKREEGYYTVYPEDLSYANYSESKDKEFVVEKSVKETAWYVYATCGKIALEYLKTLPACGKIGGFGFGKGANVLWQVVYGEKDFACACFVLGTGWDTYKGIHKFGKTLETEISEDKLSFVAGLEAQSYAKGVKCPCFVLSATNNYDFDCDRAADTLARLPQKVYGGINYSVGHVENVNYDSYKNALLFLDACLIKGDTSALKKMPEIDAEQKEDRLEFSVKPDKTDLVSLTLFVAEETVDPAFRTWRKVAVIDKFDGKNVSVSYLPFYKTKEVFAFAVAKYENGFKIGSNILNKKITEISGADDFKNLVLLSTRLQEKSYWLSEVMPEYPSFIEKESDGIKVADGPMGIKGLYSKNGIVSFKPCMEKFKPNDDSILLLDVFNKEGGEITVSILTFDGQKYTEYSVKQKIVGGNNWNNVKLDLKQFKTEEGMILKDVSTVKAVKVYAGEKYLFNNVLWV